MEILTDNEGTSWRLTGTPNQVTVERRPPLTQDEVAKGLTIADKAWRAASYHNRMDHAMSWLLDQILRMELDEAEAGQFVALVSGWKAKLESVGEYWRKSLAATTTSTYQRSFTEA